MRSWQGIVIVGRDLRKPDVYIQRTGRFHIIKCVQQHAVVSSGAGCIKHSLGQVATQTRTSKILADKQPLHFSGVWVIYVVDLT